MFEDATFDSMGRIRTRSRGWMIATFTFNGSILLALILIPLIYPQALPHQAIAFLMEAPAPPPAPQPPPQPTAHAFHGVSEVQDGHFFAPSKIPGHIALFSGPEQAPGANYTGIDQDTGVPGGTGYAFHGQGAPRVVHPEVNAPVRIAGTVEAGLLLQKTIPQYPPMAVAMRVEGTVVLAATISKGGTIENLRVTSGPALLQQAALDAVKTWRYRPYLLDGQPVEVETTVNVIFTLGR
ncbi:MAG: energy transducer TonB [Terracidiphilus sp.]|jgi:protein TonB